MKENKSKKNLYNINYGQDGFLNQYNNITKRNKNQNISNFESMLDQFQYNAPSNAELMFKEIDKKIGKKNNTPTDKEEKLNKNKTTDLNDIDKKDIKFQNINPFSEIKNELNNESNDSNIFKNNYFQNKIIYLRKKQNSIYNSCIEDTPKKPNVKIKEYKDNKIKVKNNIFNKNNNIICENKNQGEEQKDNENLFPFLNLDNFEDEKRNAEKENNFYNDNNEDRMSISYEEQDQNENNHNSTIINEAQNDNNKENLKVLIYTVSSPNEENETNKNKEDKINDDLYNISNYEDKDFIKELDEYFDNKDDDDILKDDENLEANKNINGLF